MAAEACRAAAIGVAREQTGRGARWQTRHGRIFASQQLNRLSLVAPEHPTLTPVPAHFACALTAQFAARTRDVTFSTLTLSAVPSV